MTLDCQNEFFLKQFLIFFFLFFLKLSISQAVCSY